MQRCLDIGLQAIEEGNMPNEQVVATAGLLFISYWIGATGVTHFDMINCPNSAIIDGPSVTISYG